MGGKYFIKMHYCTFPAALLLCEQVLVGGGELPKRHAHPVQERCSRARVLGINSAPQRAKAPSHR